MHDLPDAITAGKASDEINALRETLAWKHRSQTDIDDDGPKPNPSTAGELRLRSPLAIVGCQGGADDERPARSRFVPERGNSCGGN